MANINDLVINLSQLIEAIVEEKLEKRADYELNDQQFSDILDYIRDHYDPSDHLDLTSIVRDEVQQLNFEVSVY